MKILPFAASTTPAAENGRGLVLMISIGRPHWGNCWSSARTSSSARGAQSGSTRVPSIPCALTAASIAMSTFMRPNSNDKPANSKRVVRGEPHGGWRTEPDESIAVTGPRIAPIAPVGNVIRVEAKADAALFATGSVACAEAEEVVAGDADRVVACGFLAAGVAPAGHQMQAFQVRQRKIRKYIRVQMRHIEHLLVVERWRARIAVDGADERCRRCQPQPVRGLALRVHLDAVVGFSCFLFKAEVAWAVEFARCAECVGGLNNIGIEERCAHVKERG